MESLSRACTRFSCITSTPEPQGTSRMRQLLQRKPIADLMVGELETPQSLRRVLSAGDLIMLAIGAVIGAGIFGAIGTPAAGQGAPDGSVTRYSTGPRPALS